MKREFLSNEFGWQGVEPTRYKDERGERAGMTWLGVTRHVISGAGGEPCTFALRYFEVAPGGFTSLERHRHIHSVTTVRGRGYAIVGHELHTLLPLDHVYVPPMTAHQFVNDGDEPFGFLCIVDADRDLPQALPPDELATLRSDPAVGKKIRL